MQDVDNQQTSIKSWKIAQSTINPPSPNQTQTSASAPPPSQTPPKKLLKKMLIIIILVMVLIGLILVGFNLYKVQQIKKRDQQRKADITRIQGALEIYKSGTLNARYYPTVLISSTLEETGSIPIIPTDPLNTEAYVYTYIGSPSPCAGGCIGYTLTACLENKNDKEKNTTSPIAPCTTRSYQVSK